MKLVAFVILILIGSMAKATVVSFTRACHVQSFTSKEVKCGGAHPYSVPRAAISKDQLKVNEAVLINMDLAMFEASFQRRKPAQAK